MLESVLVSLDGRTELAENIVKGVNKHFGTINPNIVLDSINSQKFSDGELCVDFQNSIRGKRVYILSSPTESDEIIKMALALDAAKRAAAKEIIMILPYYPYARQDKKDQDRGSIGAKVIAKMIEGNGATGLITYDLHADQIQGYFDIPLTHLEGKNVFDSYIASIYDEDTILCGPDAGSGKRVKRMKDVIEKEHGIVMDPYVILDKTRKKANEIGDMFVIGDVVGKNVIIIDDMVDTAGTLCKAAEVLLESGAKSVRAVISHGVLSGPAIERINNSVLTELVVSDSLEIPKNDKIKVISVDKQIALAISAINSHSSYEGLKKERF